MFLVILSALYFLLPAYIANMCPVFASSMKLPLGIPINIKLFGSHKTIRGFYTGYLGALGMLYLQKILQEEQLLESLRLLNYSEINILFAAILFGGGALTGDLVKSFFKRRLHKKAGAPWFPFDQIDLVIGALIFVVPFFPLDPTRIIILIIISPLLNIIVNMIGYTLGLKDVWW